MNELFFWLLRKSFINKVCNMTHVVVNYKDCSRFMTLWIDMQIIHMYEMNQLFKSIIL